MTIELRITDLNTVDKEVLKHTAAYLLALAGHQLVKAPEVLQVNNNSCVTNKTDEVVTQTQTETESQLPEISNDVDFVPPEKDSAGKEWDPMLHSSTRKKNADGTWRLKRVVEPAKKIEEVVQEQLPSDNTIIDALVASEVSSVSTVTEELSPPPIDTDIFVIFTQKAVQAIKAGTITQANIVAVANSYGLKNVAEIARRPDLIHLIAAELSINLAG